MHVTIVYVQYILLNLVSHVLREIDFSLIFYLNEKFS